MSQYIKPPHQYGDLSNDEIEELLSNYLIDSWSYSKIVSFSRNEKEFEMRYLYCIPGRVSATTYAGTAYHAALRTYFEGLKDGTTYDIADLETIAYNLIDDLPAHRWKLQKTTPTIEDCRIDASKTASVLISNFLGEVNVYLDGVKEIKFTELYLDEWINVNGVDIPMPCHCQIDLVAQSNEGKTIIIDHKSKRTFTDEKEMKFTIGRQAITYAICYETATGEKVDEVWFIENKYSKNRDKSPQLVPFKVILDDDTRKLYEALLYEPLKRMLEAVSNPDYVYLINDSDNLTDKAEIYEFWSQTMLAEIDDFNIPESKKEKIKQRLKKIRDSSIASINPNVFKNFQKFASEFIQYDLSNKNMTNDEKIEHVLRSFGIVVKVQHKLSGYSSATYLLEVSAGTALAVVQKHKLDIANALNVSNVRIMKDLYVYQGKSYLAIESSIKREADLIYDPEKVDGMRIPLGVDNFGQVLYWNLNNPSTPHILCCGSTGSGKSVFLRSTIEYCLLSGVNEVVIFDPKFEFKTFGLSHPSISIFSDIEDIETAMEMLVDDMNSLVKSGKSRTKLVVFDEFADAVANSKKGKDLDIVEKVQTGFYAPKKLKGLFGDEMSKPQPKFEMKVTGRKNSLEENLRILLQKGRSSGFRIIAATQRASVKVITGDAKANFPVQVCFRVPKEIDSKVVLDEPGAESLTGKGDGLLKSPEHADTIRFQAYYKP